MGHHVQARSGRSRLVVRMEDRMGRHGNQEIGLVDDCNNTGWDSTEFVRRPQLANG